MAVIIIAYYYIQKTAIHEKKNLYNNTTTQDNDLIMTMAQDLKSMNSYNHLIYKISNILYVLAHNTFYSV